MKIGFKRFAAVCCLVFLGGLAFCQETLSFFDGKVTFQRPEGALLYEEVQSSGNRNTISMQIYLYDDLVSDGWRVSERIAALAKARGRNLAGADLLGLFNSGIGAAIVDISPRDGDINSFSHLVHNGTVIGESVFGTQAGRLNTPSFFYFYTIAIVVDTSVVIIRLFYSTAEEIFSRDMFGMFFTVRNGSRFWKDDSALLRFYGMFNSQEYRTLPRQIQQFREAYETVLQTITVRSETRLINGLRAVPAFQFDGTYVTTRSVPAMENAGMPDSGRQMMAIPEGTSVQLMETDDSPITIGGITAPMAKVATREGFLGWVFSGHLAFQATGRTADRLRVRENPDTASAVVTTLDTGTQVRVLETGATETIGGITAPWVKVLSENGFTGWAFSGYIEPVE